MMGCGQDEPMVTVFLDETSFLATSGAVETVTYPTAKAQSPTPYTENGVTLSSAADFNNQVAALTPVFTGNVFGVSGAENVDIEFATPVFAFGLQMQDGFAVGEVVEGPCPASDSRFEFVFLSGGVLVGSTVEDPPVDEVFFVGGITNRALDKVEIREVGSAIDESVGSHCENDFFGPIYTSTSPQP